MDYTGCHQFNMFLTIRPTVVSTTLRAGELLDGLRIRLAPRLGSLTVSQAADEKAGLYSRRIQLANSLDTLGHAWFQPLKTYIVKIWFHNSLATATCTATSRFAPPCGSGRRARGERRRGGWARWGCVQVESSTYR
jgi:hypothetical protein